MWIWQKKTWPKWNVNVSEDILRRSVEQARRYGELFGSVQMLSEEDNAEAYIDAMVTEAVNSFAIEGEFIEAEKVRSSIKCNLGLLPASHLKVEAKEAGAVALSIEIRKKYKDDISRGKLSSWQKLIVLQNALYKLKIGDYRDDAQGPMQIVSGKMDKPKVHYEAVPAKKIPLEMTKFINWFNSTNTNRADKTYTPPSVRAAQAHAWFTMIHPYDDGNGRISRALCECVFSQSFNSPLLFSLSEAIKLTQKEYSSQLDILCKGDGDINEFSSYMLDVSEIAQSACEKRILFSLKKYDFLNQASFKGANDRQKMFLTKILNKRPDAFEDLGFAARHYSAIAKTSSATASRDLHSLVKLGLAVQDEGKGRSVRYKINLPHVSLFQNSI